MVARYPKVIIQISKFLLILLFTYAAASKLMEHDQFVAQLGRVPFLKSFAAFLSLFLPAVELITALCLVFERTLMAGLLLSALLMTAFTLFIGMMLLFSSHLPCSCGGVIAKMTWPQHFVFNLFFTALSWNAFAFYSKMKYHIISANTKEGS